MDIATKMETIMILINILSEKNIEAEKKNISNLRECIFISIIVFSNGDAHHNAENILYKEKSENIEREDIYQKESASNVQYNRIHLNRFYQNRTKDMNNSYQYGYIVIADFLGNIHNTENELYLKIFQNMNETNVYSFDNGQRKLAIGV